VLSGSEETVACRFSTTSSRFWLICGRTIFNTSCRGKWNGGGNGGRHRILSVIVVNPLLDIVTCCPARNPGAVGEDYSVAHWISFVEAMSDVVRCSRAVPDHAGASVEMAFLLRARTGRTWNGGSGIILQRRSILLRGQSVLLRWGGVLSWKGSILLRRGGILLGLWSSLCILIDGAGEHALHPSKGVLEYGRHVLRFDYNSSWQRCTESRENGKDGRDTGLCDGTNR
jgi:hypothetical protein